MAAAGVVVFLPAPVQTPGAETVNLVVVDQVALTSAQPAGWCAQECSQRPTLHLQASAVWAHDTSVFDRRVARRNLS